MCTPLPLPLFFFVQALEASINTILTAIVQGMQAAEVNNDVRFAATLALNNALEFIVEPFENDAERDYIMTVRLEGDVLGCANLWCFGRASLLVGKGIPNCARARARVCVCVFVLLFGWLALYTPLLPCF